MVKASSEEGDSGRAPADRCAACGAKFSPEQRYCLGCGSRRGPLPEAIAKRIDALKRRGRDAEGRAKERSAAPAEPVEADEAQRPSDDRWDFMPSPQIAAVAVMALLAAGVVLGSVTNPLARGAGAASVILEVGSKDSSPDEEEEPAAEVSAPVAEAPASAPVPVPEAPLAAPLETPVGAEPAAPPAQLPPELPEEEQLPEIKHVFLIVLDGHGYEEAFGEESPAPYLANDLVAEGKLLTNYYAVAQGGLANEIALLSGQGPTPQTVLDCPEYAAISPGTPNAEGQVEGEGCVYPSATATLPGQLADAKLTWKAYVEPGPLQAWRNPFPYFAGLGEGPESPQVGARLDQLATDLGEPKQTPSLSYIVPNACHDGSETPCAPEQAAGLGGSEAFLQTVVPEITASTAYQDEGGLIAITFDQAPQGGPEPDDSACCATPEYPNLPAPPPSEPAATGPVKPSGGGGQVGMLLISPYVDPGTVDEAAYYNHFSFLRSVEELFGLEPLGYAAEPALSGFDSSVFDASPEESTVVEPAG